MTTCISWLYTTINHILYSYNITLYYRISSSNMVIVIDNDFWYDIHLNFDNGLISPNVLLNQALKEISLILDRENHEHLYQLLISQAKKLGY